MLVTTVLVVSFRAHTKIFSPILQDRTTTAVLLPYCSGSALPRGLYTYLTRYLSMYSQGLGWRYDHRYVVKVILCMHNCTELRFTSSVYPFMLMFVSAISSTRRILFYGCVRLFFGNDHPGEGVTDISLTSWWKRSGIPQGTQECSILGCSP